MPVEHSFRELARQDGMNKKKRWLKCTWKKKKGKRSVCSLTVSLWSMRRVTTKFQNFSYIHLSRAHSNITEKSTAVRNQKKIGLVEEVLGVLNDMFLNKLSYSNGRNEERHEQALPPYPLPPPSCQFICWSLNPRCHDIWRWGLWEVIRWGGWHSHVAFSFRKLDKIITVI